MITIRINRTEAFHLVATLIVFFGNVWSSMD